MDTQKLKIGDRIEHPGHGAGTVTFVGADYLGITFDDRGEALIRRETLEKDFPFAAGSPEPRPAPLSWPASTFVSDSVEAQHFLGSHWEPFVEDANEILGRLPELIANALVQTGYGADRKPRRVEPADWPKGFQLVWPLRDQGLAMILRIEKEANMMVSMFPFFATGSQHTLTLNEVTVWEGGLEAQITAAWGEAEVTFFDSQYPINRLWYEAGKAYDFILSGVAYSVGPAETRELKVNQSPEVVAWMNQRLQEGEAEHEAACTVRLDGTAIFLPLSGGDVDDFSFHAPVKSVSEFKDWLGQDGWRVRATVMRFGDEDADLDILVTRRAWTGAAPPHVGQDIEGLLWLQGYLWMPG